MKNGTSLAGSEWVVSSGPGRLLTGGNILKQNEINMDKDSCSCFYSIQSVQLTGPRLLEDARGVPRPKPQHPLVTLLPSLVVLKDLHARTVPGLVDSLPSLLIKHYKFCDRRD